MAFFRKAFRCHGDPRVITLDGFEPIHASLRRMGMNNDFNYRYDGDRPDSKLSLLEQRCRTRVSVARGTRRFLLDLLSL